MSLSCPRQASGEYLKPRPSAPVQTFFFSSCPLAFDTTSTLLELLHTIWLPPSPSTISATDNCTLWRSIQQQLQQQQRLSFFVGQLGESGYSSSEHLSYPSNCVLGTKGLTYLTTARPGQLSRLWDHCREKHSLEVNWISGSGGTLSLHLSRPGLPTQPTVTGEQV